VVYVVDGSGRQCFAEQVMTGGRAGRLPLLGALAQETGGRCWKSDAAGLRGAFLAVVRELRGRYLHRYEPRGVSRKGWHDLQVRLRGRRGALVRARRGYLVAN
jgi:hypothetical protein